MTTFSRKLLQLSTTIITATIGISFAKPYYERTYKYPQNNLSEITDFVNEKEEKLAIIIGGGVNGICNAFELHKKGYKTAIIEINNDVAKACSNATWGGMSTSYSYHIDKNSIFNNNNNNKNENSTNKYNSFNPIYVNWTKMLFDLHFLRWGFSFLLHRNWLFNQYKSLNIFNDNEQNDLNIITEQNTIKYMTQFVENAALYQINFIKNNQYIADLKEQCQLNENGFVYPIRYNDKKHCKYFQNIFAKNDTNNNGIYAIKDDAQKPVIYDANILSLKQIGKDIGDENLLSNLPHNHSIKYVKHSSNGYLAQSPQFCMALKQYLIRNESLKFVANTKVLDFDIDSETKTISRIYTDNGLINIKNKNVIVVLSAGSWTPILGRKLNLFIPVYPLKGFDFVIDYSPANIAYNDYINIPKYAIVDNSILYVNYGKINDRNNQVRLASIGAFNGWDNNCFDAQMENALYLQSKEMLPNIMKIFRAESMNCVSGLRPLTYDLSIIVGKIKEYNNLYMGVGPGYNGFKTAMGSARLLAQIVDGDNKANYFDPCKHNVKKSTLFCKLTDLLSTKH